MKNENVIKILNWEIEIQYIKNTKIIKEYDIFENCVDYDDMESEKVTKYYHTHFDSLKECLYYIADRI